jgi:DNA-binding transcriptional LysR family regulator
VGAPSYFKTRSETKKPQDLIDHNCITLRLPCGGLYAWEFENGGRELRVRVEGQLTYNTTDQMLNAAFAGLCLAYVPEGLAQPNLAEGRLKPVLEDWCLQYSGYHLWYPSRRQSSAAFALLVDALRHQRPEGVGP